LEERQKVIEFLLLRAAVEAHPARVQQSANQPNAKKVIWGVDETGLPWQGSTLGCKCNAAQTPTLKHDYEAHGAQMSPSTKAYRK
jgi:hypothetical protein